MHIITKERRSVNLICSGSGSSLNAVCAPKNARLLLRSAVMRYNLFVTRTHDRADQFNGRFAMKRLLKLGLALFLAAFISGCAAQRSAGDPFLPGLEAPLKATAPETYKEWKNAQRIIDAAARALEKAAPAEWKAYQAAAGTQRKAPALEILRAIEPSKTNIYEAALEARATAERKLAIAARWEWKHYKARRKAYEERRAANK